MSLRPLNAASSELGILIVTKSVECSQCCRVLADCTQVVRDSLSACYCRADIVTRVSNVSSTRSRLGREDIKWSELLGHFRAVQNKHEKSRRQAAGDTGDFILPLPGFASDTASSIAASGANGNPVRPGMRRRVTGGASAEASLARPPSRALSPLNPRARGSSSLGQASQQSNTSTVVPSSPTFNLQNQRQPKRTLSISRKT